MALSILDGNQSATTLSTILTSGQHITAHTVVSLGTQAITDMRGAVSGSVVSVSSLPAISGTVTANGIAFNEGEGAPDKAVWMAYNLNDSLQGVSNSAPLPISGTVTANSNVVSISLSAFPLEMISGGDLFKVELSTINEISPPTWLGAGGGNVPISGTVTANLPIAEAWAGIYDSGNDCIKIELANLNGDILSPSNPLPISGTVTIGSALPAGTNRIGVVTIGGGTVTIGAGTAQIGSVTVGNSVTIGSLPAISGTVTANTFAIQGTAVTTSNFTSTTASTVLASFNATREVLTIFNEGAGNLHICAGATCTTIAYQVRLSAGDYYEVPNHQTTITHSAVFATAGTARVTEVS
jgi:hypothetical protein